MKCHMKLVLMLFFTFIIFIIIRSSMAKLSYFVCKISS